jgi:plastocyanin
MKKYTLAVFAMTLLVGMVFHTSLFAVTHTVQVGNYYFNPSSLNVEVGDIVKWVWVQGSHTTTSSSIPGGATSWDEPITSGNPTFSYTVTVVGVYNYVCTPHAGMGQTGSFTATAPAPTLTVTPANQNVSASAGNTSFTITSNISWNASSNQSWCTVNGSGTGNGTIAANYTVNSTTSSRVATITVSGTGVSDQVVTVTQEGAAATLAVTPPIRMVSESSGTTDFSVTSNSSWTAASDASWCTVTSSGSGNGTIMATYAANSSTNERAANITVTVSGLTPVIIQVIQDGTSVGVPDNNALSFRIFPNPANDLIRISLDNMSLEKIRISLIDLTGKTVIDQFYPGNNEVSLQVGNLPRGYYFLRIIAKDEAITRRVILVE